jgi:hypothetical protein
MNTTRHSTLVRNLLDDAAIFPPGNAPIPVAVADHLRHLAGPLAPLIGSFVVSDSRLTELTQALAHAGMTDPVDVTLVVGPGDLVDVLGQLPGLRDVSLHAVETSVSSAAEATVAARIMASSDAVLYLEPGLGAAVFDEVVDVASKHGARVKLRAGGTTGAAFPTSPLLAGAIERCVNAGVPFKCTAGLHHATRHRDPATGFAHHGFLNVLLAAGVTDQLGTSATADVLEQTDAAMLASGLSSLGPDGLAIARRRFVSFGTCSLTDPVDDLTELGLLDDPREAALG